MTGINNNTAHPNFGMAYRKQATKEGAQKFLEYAGLTNSKVKQRGFKQFVKEQAGLKRFDVEFVHDDYLCGGMKIINNKTNEVVDTIYTNPEITGVYHFGMINYPGKKLIARLFNPKQFLPQSMLEAGKAAQKLEQEAIKAEKINEGIGKLV